MTETSISHDVLPEGYPLLWYIIKSVLGQGGFGVTYLAMDTNLDRLVAIKEYMPIEFSVRDAQNTVHPRTGQMGDVYQWGLKSFLSEGKTLARFKHPNIVRVLSVFEHNNTAYMVMEYEQGEDLSNLFERNLYKTEEDLIRITLPILDGLSRVHQAGFIHRDIKPANIYIRKDGSPVLLDFGSARQALSGEAQAITTLVTRGYTPFEQYNDAKGEQGPCSDIYTMGATLYMAITGEPPVDALVRGAALLNNQEDPYEPLCQVASGRYSEGFLYAIDEALQFHLQQRPQSVERWQELLLKESEQQDGDKTRTQQRVPTQDAEPPLDRTVIHQRVRLSDEDIELHGANTEKITKPRVRKKRKKASLFSRNMKSILVFSTIVFVIVGLIYLNLDSDNKQANIVDLLEQAEEAVSASRLITPEGNNALEAYQAVLEREPNNVKARLGIEDIFKHYLQLSADAFKDKQLDVAAENLMISERIQPDNYSTKQLRLKLEKTFNPSEKKTRITQALQAAKLAFGKGNVLVPLGKSALDKYREAAELEPDNTEALQGMNEVTDYLVQRVKQSVSEGNLAAAETDMQTAKRLNLQSDKFSLLRQQLTMAHKENIKQRSITRLLEKAKQSYSLKQWTSPQGNNALEYYQEVLRLEPDNNDALRGLEKMVTYFIRRMDENINIGNSQSAGLNLKKAETIQPKNQAVKKARTRWQKTIQRLGSSSDSSPEVSKLVASFKQAIEQCDMDKLQSVANLSRQLQRLTEQLFSKYQTIEVSVTELMVAEQKGEASARVTLISLIDKNGDSFRPGMSWQNMQITTNKEGGRWTKVNWW